MRNIQYSTRNSQCASVRRWAFAIAVGPMLAAVLLLASADASAAEGPRVVKLWPGDPPGMLKHDQPEKAKHGGRATEVHIPTLSVYLPAASNATGTAVLVCPGGGYGHLAMGHEGAEVAKWLNSLGVAAVVLKYRHRPYRHPVPLEDASRAMRWIRNRAQEYRVRPNRVGILGFSAGGHLASTVMTHWDRGNPTAKGALDRASCRPDFGILIYPVISLHEGIGHMGSRRNLLGDSPTPELIDELSNDTQVASDTPPTLLVHARDDRGVKPINSERFHAALQAAGISSELIYVEKGGHGFGLRHGWPEKCAAWMRGRGLLSAP
jgi:acetyl esterase/lipase